MLILITCGRVVEGLKHHVPIVNVKLQTGLGYCSKFWTRVQKLNIYNIYIHIYTHYEFLN